MAHQWHRMGPVLALYGILGIACLAAVNHSFHKAGLPLALTRAEPPVIVRSIDGVPLSGSPDDIEFFLASYRIGDDIRVELESPTGFTTQVVRTEAYYTPGAIILDTVITGIMFVLGLFVYVMRPQEKAPVLFTLGSGLLCLANLGTKTLCAARPAIFGIVPGTMFFFSYALIPLLFLHFTFVFPGIRWAAYRRLFRWLYPCLILLAGWQALLYLRATAAHSVVLLSSSNTVSAILSFIVLILMVAGVLNFILSYRATTSTAERKKLRWILYGLTLGPAPFVVLWVLPQAFGLSPWIPEGYFKLSLIFIPVTFTISILRHKLMDIDLLINRSAVYGIVVAVMVAVYAVFVVFVSRLVETTVSVPEMIPPVLITIVIAVMFDPLRRSVQRFVDRSLFRVQYNYREAERKLTEEINACTGESEIDGVVMQRVNEVLPVERIGVFRVPGSGADATGSGASDIPEDLRSSMTNNPVALAEAVEPGTCSAPADPQALARAGISLAVPMLTETGEVRGALILGRKKSGLRFTAEDIDLLRSVGIQAGMAAERTALRQKLLIEHLETRRLEELSRMKSLFVSSVSHDLKTPLTAIRMFAELLRTGKKIPAADRIEYLEIIEGESDRLTRLINTVLDFAKMERGTKTYSFGTIDLNDIVRRTLRSMNYIVKMEKAGLRVAYCRDDCFIHGDGDAVTEALVNLVGNALKYSLSVKELSVTTFRRDAWAGVSVCDKGIGIGEEDIGKIFEPFYRAGEPRSHGAGGAGLGLAVVKQIMDAHRGLVEVRSTPRKGSTFTLLFPADGPAGHEIPRHTPNRHPGRNASTP